MKAHEAERLIAVIRELATEEGIKSLPKVEKPSKVNGHEAAPLRAAIGTMAGPLSPDDIENLYQTFVSRVIAEAQTNPIMARLLLNTPELVLEFEPKVITLDGSTTRGRVARLIADGWFNTAKTIGGTRAEMKRTGPDPGGGSSLYDITGSFVRDGLLTKEGDGFLKAPGLKVTEKTIETKG